MRTPKRIVNAQTGEVSFRVRYRKDGVQRSITFYGDTEQDARADAEMFVIIMEKQDVVRAVEWWNSQLGEAPGTIGLTLDEWWPRYIASSTGISKGTRVTYERTYARVWKPALGNLPLAAIGREQIARVVNQLSHGGAADKTVRNAYGILATCLRTAHEDGHLAVPPKRVKLPRVTEHNDVAIRFLDRAEWERLYAALPAHYRPLFVFLVGTGARWGEAEALTVGDVDLDRTFEESDGSLVVTPTVTINKAAKWNASKARREVGPTKTRRSNRTIYIGPVVAQALAPLVADRKKSERLFLAPKGGELRHPTVYHSWQLAVTAAGLDPRPRIHDLRHTYATWQISRGTPLTVIQRNLGHEKITTTSDTYGHLLPEVERAAAEAASMAMYAPRELGPSGGSSA